VNLLLLLVGGSPIANYALIKYFKHNGDDVIPKFDQVVLVYSTGTKKVADNIKILNKDVTFIDIDIENNESNLKYIKELTLKTFNEIGSISSVHLNYTGGRKPMSLGTYLAVSECNGKFKRIYSDIDPSNYKLTLEDGNTYLAGEQTISSNINIPIKEFYLLHTLSEPTFQSEHSEFYSETFCTFLLNKCDTDETTFYINLWDNEGIKQLEWKESISDVIDVTNISNNKLKELQKFIRGQWLEEYLYEMLQEIKEEVNITDLAWNITATSKAKDFEVDVIAISGYKSFVFTCTTDKKAHIKQKAFEGFFRSAQLGGNNSMSIIVCLAESEVINGVIKDMDNLNRSNRFKAIGIEDVRDKSKFKEVLLGIFQ